ncbi:MAG: nhaA [Gammaproteobacteria bacterium]|jgi:NhaA family Na+:H+ antiporter|nr:nhaA [Gammaproteobacteria bacterium]
MKNFPAKISNRLREFIALESSAGIFLFAGALLALILANSSGYTFYHQLLNTELGIKFAHFRLEKSLLLWINEGLMAVYFLLVTLEIKRECLVGHLQKGSIILLPAVGAAGGVIFPALIYVALNYHNPVAVHGWAIPSATDIAFSLAILSLIRNVPIALKIFLSTLAILDDLAAIVIIAVFYTEQLSFSALLAAGIAMIVLITFNRLGIKKLLPYYLVGILLWLSVLESGVHATLAGVALALTIPLGDTKSRETSPLIRAEKRIHPWIIYLILPLFGFANSGFTFQDLHFESHTYTIPLGIALGLFIGKQCGIFSFCWIFIKNQWASLPPGIHLSELYGISLLCGIGFTMSLFIGSLAFPDNQLEYAALIRLGVLSGSLLSGVFGYLLLLKLIPKRK